MSSSPRTPGRAPGSPLRAVGPALLAAALLVATGACDSRHVAEPDGPGHARTTASVSPSGGPAASTNEVTLSPRLSRPAPERLVAVGDLHGDLDHTRRVLRLAGAIDAKDHWIGGHLMLVQTGDAIDRGDDDRAILDLFEALKKEASAAGGEVIALLGNHEVMNAALDFRYVTRGGFAAFEGESADASAPPADVPPASRGRAAAFAPGGAYALLESQRPIMVKVGRSVFVHGGILPKHVAYGLDKMNDELDAWLTKKRAEPPAPLVAEDGPIWTRAYSNDQSPADCASLRATLAQLGAARMVVGHTVQRGGVTKACDDAVIRIDVGLSRYYGGPIQAIEIRGETVSILKEPG